MKKFSLLTIALLLLGLSVQAQESISVGEVLVPQGRQALMPVLFHFNDGHSYVSYQFKVELPEGITLVNEGGTVPVELGEGQPANIFKGLDLNPSSHILTCYSNPSTVIEGTEGILVYVPIEADETLAVGTELTGSLTGVAFASIDAASHSFANASFTVKIQNPGIYFDENDTKLPLYKAGEKDHVYMNRTIKANEWSTIVLPFTLTKAKAEAAFGSDIQLAEFSSFEADYGDNDENDKPLGITINFSTYTMTSRKGMTGGKPFLIKTSKDITSFDADDCSLIDAVTEVSKSDDFDTPGKFTGSFVKTVVPEDGLFISNQKFWYSTGKTNIKAFRGWFELDAVLGKPTDFGVKIFIDGIETGIEGLNTNRPAIDHEGIYDLGGRKLSDGKSDAHIRRGVYIVNGQKVIIK